MILKLFLALGVVTLLASCGKKDDSPAPSVKPKEYFYHGSIDSLLKGSTLNKTSFLTPENIQKFDGFAINSMIIFESIGEKDTTKPTQEDAQDKIEKGQEPSDDKLPEVSKIHVKEQDGYYYMNLRFHKINWNVLFSLENNSLHLKYIEIQDSQGNFQRAPVEILHYSVKEDFSVFSLLFKLEEDDVEVLFSITASQYTGEEEIAPQLEEKYNTLLAQGYETKWHEDTITLHTCGLEEKDTLNIQKMISIWSEKQNMTIGDHIQIEVKPLLNYAPFSDVNQHCLYFVDDFLVENSDYQTAPAFTVSQFHPRTGQIYDADILMMKKAFEKIEGWEKTRTLTQPDKLFDTTVNEATLNKKEKSYFTHVVQHEFGHFLGLDHIFDGTTSIMSYNTDKNGWPDLLSSYDYRAINTLYKKR